MTVGMSPGLKATRVSYSVRDKPLVKDVDLDIRPGELLAVVGPNGAGKSTLCGILAGDLPPTEGEVEICGRPLRGLKPGDLARLRSMLSQHTVLRFPFTAQEVALMGRHPHIPLWKSPTEADYSQVETAMRSLQVLHLSERIYSTLSGGEQRRVSIARVLAQDTPVVLLDEPSSALDIGHQELVMTLCRRLADEGRCILAVLHDLNLAGAYADRVMVMSGGEVAAVASPAEALRPELLASVFHQEVLVIPHPQTNRPVVLASYDAKEAGGPTPRDLLTFGGKTETGNR